MDVFILWHENASTEDFKLLGVFESEEKANAAMRFASELPGFKSNVDGFTIDRYEVGKMHWAEGFGVEG